MPNQAAEVAICAPASDWPGGRDRGREGDAPSLVRTLLAINEKRDFEIPDPVCLSHPIPKGDGGAFDRYRAFSTTDRQREQKLKLGRSGI